MEGVKVRREVERRGRRKEGSRERCRTGRERKDGGVTSSKIAAVTGLHKDTHPHQSVAVCLAQIVHGWGPSSCPAFPACDDHLRAVAPAQAGLLGGGWGTRGSRASVGGSGSTG